jgi:malonyl-CoA/methylmalonyl-CoA synthetase
MLLPRFEPAPPPAEVTHVYGVPTWYRRWLPVMRADPAPFRRLSLLVSGSDGLDKATSDAVFAATGHRVLERYGMTETVMICSNPGRGERRAGTVGPPVPGVSVRLVDGEVQVRGPSVFSGYWVPRAQDPPPPEVPAGSDGGWFATGDAGEWDDVGYLRIVGRKKELIIVGGVNVSPAEVEAVYQGLSGVVEVGAVGLVDADLGEVVGLAVVVDGDPEDALAAIRARGAELSGLKRPRRLLVVPALPRNALGKLQRAALRQQFDASPGPKDPS